jgi:predicted nucleic acid-binding protein
MAWVVDTSVLLDIRENDPQFGLAAARCLARYLPAGLVLCPVSYIELGPEFRGDRTLQEEFFRRVGLGHLYGSYCSAHDAGGAGHAPPP